MSGGGVASGYDVNSRSLGSRSDRRLSEIEARRAGGFRRGAALSTLAALVWIPQALLLAWAIEALAFDPDRALWPLALGFVALSLLRGLLDMAGRRVSAEAAHVVLAEARGALARRLAMAGPRDAAAMATGAAASLGAEKLETLRPYLTRYPAARMRVIAAPLCLLIAVASVSWIAALALLVAGPLIPLFMALVGMAAREASERQLEEIGTMNGVLLDRLRGLLDIRLLDAGERVAADFDSAADRIRARTMAVLRIAFLSSAVLELFAALGVAMVAVYVGFALLGVIEYGGWGGGLTLGEGLFALLLAPEYFQPLRDFAAAWHDRAAAQAASAEYDAAMAEDAGAMLGDGRRSPPLAGPPTIRCKGLTVHGVRFGDGGSDAIDIKPGERIAVVGPSGVGKSAFLALLAGFQRPDSGAIEVCGVALDERSADAWRRRLAWTPQRPHFFAGSLRANVALSGDAADRDAVRAALATAAAEAIAKRASRDLDTRLGEAGEGVSGGEGRRLSIARAAFSGAEVILADEPTADLDAATAQAVSDGLFRLADGGATLIIATHDPALIARCDRRIMPARAQAAA